MHEFTVAKFVDLFYPSQESYQSDCLPLTCFPAPLKSEGEFGALLHVCYADLYAVDCNALASGLISTVILVTV